MRLSALSFCKHSVNIRNDYVVTQEIQELSRN